MRVLDIDPIDELRAKYKVDVDAENFRYIEGLKPAIVFTPKKDSKGLLI